MIEIKQQSDYSAEEEEKILQAWKNHPLTDQEVQKFCLHPLVVREITPEVLETEEMQALQSLIYDDTPENVARNMKRRGDEFLKSKHLNARYTTDARSCYEEGLEQKPEDVELVYLLKIGVLRCNILLSNFGRVLQETIKLLKSLDSEQWKNKETKKMQLLHYKAEGLFGVLEYDQTVKVCKQLLKLLPEKKQTIERKEVSQLMKRAMMESLKAQKLEEKLAAVRELDKENQQKVISEMKSLGLVIGPQAQQIPKSYPAKVTMDDQGFLHFPLLFIYPEYKITDYITDAHELSLLRDHLKRILQERPSWDTESRYAGNTVDVFYEVEQVHPFKEFEATHQTRMKEAVKTSGHFKQKYRKLDPRSSIIEALSEPGHVIAQLPVLHVVAREGAHRVQFEKI